MSAAPIRGVCLLLLIASTTGVAWSRPKTGTFVVVVADSSTGKPVRGVGVTVRPPGWWWREDHQAPDWYGTTDSTGWAWLKKIPPGNYNVELCEESYDRYTTQVEIAASVTDTLMAQLRYVGLPRCRRCEVRFTVDPKLLRRLDKRP